MGLTVQGLAAETDYYAYAVGISTTGEMTTEFVKVQVTSEPLSTFDATIEVDVNGPDATVTVTPADETIGWYPTVFIGQGHSNADMIASAQNSIEGVITNYSFFGMSREQAVVALTNHGQLSLQFELDATSDYTAAAFSIDANGYITSNPAIKEFTTGEAAMSDNQISQEIVSNNGRRVEYNIMTTNDDPYVFFTYQYTGTWTEMTDQEIIDYIMANEDISWMTRYGSVSTYVEGLRQQTEYITFAFGVDGGVATTELFRFPFTTAEATMNDLKFSYSYGPYYNGDEAAAKYPDQLANAAGRIVFPAQYQIDGDWHGIWHDLYQGDLTDKAEYPDEDVYQALRVNGNTWLSATIIYILDPNEVYTMCGFVEADDGSFGEIYRQVVGPFTLDGCSPIDDFTLESSAAAFSRQNVECPFRPVDYMSPVELKSVKQAETVQMGLSTEKETGSAALKAVEVEDVVIYNNLSSRL